MTKTATELKRNKKNGRCGLMLAFTYASISAVCGAFAAVLVKFVHSSGPDQILLSHYAVQYMLLLPTVTRQSQSLFETSKNIKVLLLVRAGAGAASTNLLYYSFKLISVGDASAIISTYTVLVGFLSCVLLKEPCGIYHIIFSLMALSGLVLIAQPSFLFSGSQETVEAHGRSLGITFACLAAVLSAVALVSVRKIGFRVPFSMSMFCYAFVGTSSSFVLMAFSSSYSLPCLRDAMFMLAIGAIGAIQLAFLTLALQNGPAGPITVVLTIRVAFAYVLEFIFLRFSPSLYSLIGAILVLVSSIGLTILTHRIRTSLVSHEGDST